MDTQRAILSPRQNENGVWVPSCFAGFGCVDGVSVNENHLDMKSIRSAPFLLLKGIGTITLGRLGEKNNILRDDIVTWKQRIEDSLYIGWVTYTTRSNLPDELHDFAKDSLYASKCSDENSLVTVIEDIEERSVYDVEYCLTEENGASPTLLQLLKVLVVSMKGIRFE